MSINFDYDKLSDSLVSDGKILTITDRNIEYNKNDLSDDIILVHCTDFFPTNRKVLCNYDGRKTVTSNVTYNGVTKKCESLSHRHSVHVTLNNVVRSTGDGAGEWDQPKFIIIDYLDTDKNNFVNLEPSDSWTYGSIELSERPILLVREDAFNEVSENEFTNYNIIKYSGDYEKCVQNIIHSLGFKTKITDPNYAGHSYSTEMSVESCLDRRNLSLNYVLDNSYNGYDNITINDEQMIDFYEVFTNGDFDIKKGDLTKKYKLYDVAASLSGVPVNFVKFVINSGIEKNNDRYSLKSDDELYIFINKIEKEIEISEDYIRERIKNGEDNINYETEIRNAYASIISKYIDISNIQDIHKSYMVNSKANITEREKILFQYGQEFGDLHGAATGDFLTKDENNILEKYETLLDRNLDTLSDEELQIVIDVQNIKLDYLSKQAKDNNQKFKLESDFYKRDIFHLVLESPDLEQRLSKMSGIDIASLWEKTNDPSISDEEADKIEYEITHIPNCHLLTNRGNVLTTDLDLSQCSSVREMSNMLIRYAKSYERFYNGEHIEFDNHGNISEETIYDNGNLEAKTEYEKAKAQFEISRKIVSEMSFSDDLQNYEGKKR